MICRLSSQQKKQRSLQNGWFLATRPLCYSQFAVKWSIISVQEHTQHALDKTVVVLQVSVWQSETPCVGSVVLVVWDPGKSPAKVWFFTSNILVNWCSCYKILHYKTYFEDASDPLSHAEVLKAIPPPPAAKAARIAATTATDLAAFRPPACQTWSGPSWGWEDHPIL